MTTLHTISKSWHDAVWLFEQLAFAAKGDAVLLLQDAVLAVHSPITLASFLAKCEMLGVAVYALGNDCRLRGIDNHYPQINLIDYSEFVNLVAQHSKQVSW